MRLELKLTEMLPVGVFLALILAVVSGSTVTAKPAPCSAPEFHQWDFWRGEWRVTDAKGVFQGSSEITAGPGCCGLVEHWTGKGGSQGQSLSGYDSTRKSWTQFWISPAEVIRLEGRRDAQGALWTEGTISYNASGVEHPFRGIWTPQADGSVRQQFFEFDPKANSWGEWFTGIYRHPKQPGQELACKDAHAHQFDFWVGKWDVFDSKTGERAGTSLIENLYGGCAIRENWSEPGFAGGSLNVFSSMDGKWHQTWVDQSGALREFVGGAVGERMILIAKTRSAKSPGMDVLVRMTFSKNPDHSVRQYSDYSRDGGRTWQERYDYRYQPAVAR